MAHNNPMGENGHLDPGPLGPCLRATRTMCPDHSDRVTSPLGRVLSATGAAELYFRRRSLSLSEGGLCDTCTNSVEELVATGTVNCFLTRPNRGKTLLTINYYDFEWHVLGLLCKILSYLHVTKVCYLLICNHTISVWHYNNI